MTEQTSEETNIRGSAFGRVLAGFMEAKGLPVDEEHVRGLAEKGGLDPEALLSRVTGESMEHAGSMSGVVRELGLTQPEMATLAVAYALEQEYDPDAEPVPEQEPERVARPEDVLEDGKERIEEGIAIPSPARCTYGSAERGEQCPREGTVWVCGGGDRRYPLCDEHKLVQELGGDCFYWETAVFTVEDWLKMADAWKHQDLEQMATNVLEDAKEEYAKAQARHDLALEVADAPRKGSEDANLTYEQREELYRRIRLSDALNSAYAVLEDAPESQIHEDAKRGTLGVLAGEMSRAARDVHKYRRELGIEKD
jgi:hypothetical protein